MLLIRGSNAFREPIKQISIQVEDLTDINSSQLLPFKLTVKPAKDAFKAFYNINVRQHITNSQYILKEIKNDKVKAWAHSGRFRIKDSPFQDPHI